MSDKAKDLYSGIKKILRSPSLGPSNDRAGRRSSSGSFSLSGALSSFSLTRSISTSSTDSRPSVSSLHAKGYDHAELAAAAAAAADEMFNDKPSTKKERRPSFSFSTWKEKHRAKKHAQQAQKDAEKVAVAYGATAATPKAVRSTSSSNQHEYDYHDPQQRHLRTSQRSLSGRSVDNDDNNQHSHHQHHNQQTHIQQQQQQQMRARSNTGTTQPSAARIARDNSVRSRAATLTRANSNTPSSSNPSAYSFTAHRQEKTRTTERASTMVADDLTTIVKPRSTHHSTASSASWDSSDTDDDEGGDAYANTSRPRTRGLSRRSVSMDFMEPQQPSHLISKIWRKLPIQARLYGRGSVDLDLEKDRTSISRSSATKQLRRQDSNSHDEYAIPPASPLPDDEANVFGDKHIRFHPKISFSPPQGEYVALESYDDALVRVCQFAAHDQRRTVVKVNEFLERSICFIRGTSTKRNQKVSIANEEIRMWRRIARHDWRQEEITTMPLSAKDTPSSKKQSPSSSSVTEEETEDDDDAIVAPSTDVLKTVADVVNCCLNTGDTLFTIEDVEELVTLELLVEEDGWI